MVKTIDNSTKDVNKKLQSLKGRTKLNFYKNISYYYDEKNLIRQKDTFQFEKDSFSKNAEGISKIYHEVLLLTKLLQTKPQVQNMIIEYNDLYYTVVKNRDDNEIVNDKYENNENEYVNLDNLITPNHYIGRKNDSEVLKWKKMRSQIKPSNKVLLYKQRRKNEKLQT